MKAEVYFGDINFVLDEVGRLYDDVYQIKECLSDETLLSITLLVD
jgi:hypothetical protein